MEPMDSVLRQNGTPKACAARGREHLAICVEETCESGGPDAQRDGPVLAQNSCGELLLRYIDHYALAQLDGVQIVEVAVEGDLVVRATIGVVEDGARNAAARELAQVGDGIDHSHSEVWGTFLVS